jgi:hypothetical protein
MALASLGAAFNLGTASDDLAAADPRRQAVDAADPADTGSLLSNAPAAIMATPRDTGVVDVNQDGEGDYASYGARNRALSVGEQGGDGHNLRYVAPFRIPARIRASVAAGSRVTLAFTVWRTDALDGRRLVITALPGRRNGRADFDRDGIQVYRGRATVGRMSVDVTRAMRAAGTGAMTFRFATDVAPAKGDGRMSQINIATADSRPVRRPSLGVTEGAVTAPAPGSAAPAPAPKRRGAAPAGMSLLWVDEFSGSTLNTRVWKPYHSTYGDGNREAQCHTPGNVVVSGGTMKITARRGKVTCPNGAVRAYSSAFLGTRETGTYFPRYGRFEIRARVPHGQGLWPAFWLRHRRGSSTAEVDVMEYFHSQVPGRSTATLHLDGRDNVSKKTIEFEAPTSSPDWHTWTVDIENVTNGVRFTFLLDGKAYHSYTDTRHRWTRAASGENLWDIAVNLSVGGNWVGDADGPLGYLPNLNVCARGGRPPNRCLTGGIRRAAFPAMYEVDYVRVYRRDFANPGSAKHAADRLRRPRS